MVSWWIASGSPIAGSTWIAQMNAPSKSARAMKSRVAAEEK
jgi:hypothetical protein